MDIFYSTQQTAQLLGMKPDLLLKAIWQNRLDPPAKSPSGQFLWTERDVKRASWALLHCAYEPQGNGKGMFMKLLKIISVIISFFAALLTCLVCLGWLEPIKTFIYNILLNK